MGEGAFGVRFAVRRRPVEVYKCRSGVGALPFRHPLVHDGRLQVRGGFAIRSICPRRDMPDTAGTPKTLDTLDSADVVDTLDTSDTPVSAAGLDLG